MRQMQDGIGEGIEGAAGAEPLAFLAVILIIGTLLVVARYIVPSRERIKNRELDIREREADNDAERIKANAALAENMRGLRESNDKIAQQFAAQNAGLEESKTRSRAMDGKVDRIDSTTQHTDTLVEDIHRHFLGGEGTD